MLQGIGVMSFESPILCFATCRKIGTLQKAEYHEASMIQECLQQFKGPKKGKVFQLCGMHLVSLCRPFYVDDAYCWYVTNIEKARKVLAKLSEHIPLIH
jgi:hypothetical protein